MKLQIVYGFLAVANTAFAANAAEWRTQSIYQVITDRFARTDESVTAPCDSSKVLYCGGTWRGLISKLDYIQDMGFTAVWISPITKNLEDTTAYGQAYHGYWQQDIYSLNSHFGTASDLRDLAKALHDRGMMLMVDIVVNHNGWNGDPSTIDYGAFHPFNQQSQYHSYCTVGSNDNDLTNIETCWLGDKNVPLADLRTENVDVARGYQDWVKSFVANYSIDGLRIDTAKHVNTDFWKPFNQAAGVFCTGEVFNGDTNYVCPYQRSLDSVLNYPVWFDLRRAFESPAGSISNLVDRINAVKTTCQDSTTLGLFSENHDNPRFANVTSDLALAKNIIAFTVLADGIPIIYNGQEQHYAGGKDPYNREAIWLSKYNTNNELYKHVAALNQVRNHAIYTDTGYVNYKNWVIYNDTTTIGMRKGSDGKQIITVLSNKGSNGAAYNQVVRATGYSANLPLIEVLACTSQTTDGSGNINVSMGQGAAKVFIPASTLTGSGICGK